ncbi:TRAP transporter small permease [Alcaligenaceae bacterium]|nr:TRAP transporter small permease [Alcaligenaceae bacterium]
MNRRKKGWNWLRSAEETFIGVLLLVITGVIFANVVLRYAFGSSLSWAEELARYGVIWITFIGGSVCVYRRLHIAVDIWGEHLSYRVNRWWLAGVHALSAATCGAFVWYSTQLVMKATQTHQKTIALGLPMWLMYGAMTIGGTLMFFRFLILVWTPPPVVSNNLPPDNASTDRTDS